MMAGLLSTETRGMEAASWSSSTSSSWDKLEVVHFSNLERLSFVHPLLQRFTTVQLVPTIHYIYHDLILDMSR
jgi:hypothetical protein